MFQFQILQALVQLILKGIPHGNEFNAVAARVERLIGGAGAAPTAAD